MAIPSRNELHRPILELANETEGDLSYGQLLDAVVARFGLTEEDLQEKLGSGPKRARKTVEWAVQNLMIAGFLSKTSRGRHEITSEGRSRLRADHAAITQAELLGLRGAQNPNVGQGGPEHNSVEHPDTEQVSTAIELTVTKSGETVERVIDATPEEMMESADSQLREKLTGDLLDSVKAISPDGFEKLTLDLLKRIGYGEPEHTGRPGDGGIDGIVYLDALGLERVYVQAKRLTNGSVGDPDMQKFVGSMITNGATKGVFITTSSFTDPAFQTARNVSRRNETIRLVNGAELADLMIRHGVGVVTEFTYEIKKLDENYFADEI